MRHSLTVRTLLLLSLPQAAAGVLAAWAWASYGGQASLPAYTAFLVALSVGLSAPVLNLVVVRPIRDVVSVLDDATVGEGALRLDEREAGELGTLARSVNRLVDTLEQRDSGLRQTLRIIDLSYRLAKAGTNSYNQENAKEAIRDALADAYPGMHTWFVYPGKPQHLVPGAYRALAAEAELQGGLVRGDNPNAWQVAIPVVVSETQSIVLVLYSAITNEYPSDADVQTISSQVTMALSSASNYHRATTDGLTGMHNKQHGAEWLEQVLGEAHRYGHAASLIALDIDHFKRVNDTHGHSTGDAVLRRVAETLLGSIRSTDIGIRNGGEEFLVLLPHTRQSQAAILAEKLRAAVEALAIDIAAPNSPLKVTISLGVAELESNEPAFSWVDRADAALYAAKRGGRNRVCLATGSADSH